MMPSPVRSSCDDDCTTDFLSLPNEILTEIIIMSSEKDRQCIGAVNQRLRALDRNAGHRRFTSVKIYLVRHPIFEVFAGITRYRFDRRTPDHEIIDFFRHSTTNELIIKGRVDIADILRTASSTIKFKNLKATCFGDYSGGIISHLVHGQTGIESIDITWANLRVLTRPAKRMLLSLPPVKNCTITALDKLSCLIDDDIFLHLAKNVSGITKLFCKETAITANGIYKAFEMLITAQQEQGIWFPVNRDEFTKMFDLFELDNRFVATSTECVIHRTSKALISCKHIATSSEWRGLIWSGAMTLHQQQLLK